mmetsp:Transcript_29371/g.67600  ORF Transcript_29371/g.67600 Transcript_29371/m.67600 type:complete len:246 (+) Transcript_29371:1602-2339(+)
MIHSGDGLIGGASSLGSSVLDTAMACTQAVIIKSREAKVKTSQRRIAQLGQSSFISSSLPSTAEGNLAPGATTARVHTGAASVMLHKHRALCVWTRTLPERLAGLSGFLLDCEAHKNALPPSGMLLHGSVLFTKKSSQDRCTGSGPLSICGTAVTSPSTRPSQLSSLDTKNLIPAFRLHAVSPAFSRKCSSPWMAVSSGIVQSLEIQLAACRSRSAAPPANSVVRANRSEEISRSALERAVFRIR